MAPLLLSVHGPAVNSGSVIAGAELSEKSVDLRTESPFYLYHNHLLRVAFCLRRF